MSLNGEHLNQIQRAFLDAFSLEELRQFVRIHLDENLDEIAGGRNFSDITLDLIAWAKRKGRIREMIDAALRQNPDNRQLQVLAEQPWIATADSLSDRHVQQRSYGQTWQGKLPARLWTVALVIALLVVVLAIVVVMTPSDQLHTTTLTPITANSSEHSSHSIDLDLASPYVDGLQLKVTRVEESNGIVKVEVVAKHADIGLSPFGPRVVDHHKEQEYYQEAEKEEREWRNLQSTEFIFQDEEGRIYEVDASRSSWDREVTPNGTARGFMIISDTLQSSVSQLNMIYADIYHGERVAMRIDDIPMPKQGISALPSESKANLADCSFVTSSPALSAESLQDTYANIPIGPGKIRVLPSPIVQDVLLNSDTVCGITLGVRRVTRDERGGVDLEMVVANEEMPYPLDIQTSMVAVTKGQNVLQLSPYFLGSLMTLQSKGEKEFSLYVEDVVPLNVTELSASITLPGGQVLMLDHIPLPVVPDELLANASEPVVKVNQSQTIAPGVTATIVSAEWHIRSFFDPSSLIMTFELANDTDQSIDIWPNFLIKDDQQIVLFAREPTDILQRRFDYGHFTVPPRSRIQKEYNFVVDIPFSVKSLSVQFTDGVLFEGVPVPPGRP